MATLVNASVNYFLANGTYVLHPGSGGYEFDSLIWQHTFKQNMVYTRPHFPVQTWNNTFTITLSFRWHGCCGGCYNIDDASLYRSDRLWYVWISGWWNIMKTLSIFLACCVENPPVRQPHTEGVNDIYSHNREAISDVWPHNTEGISDLARDCLPLARDTAFFLPRVLVSEPPTRFLYARTRDTLNLFLEWGNPLKSDPFQTENWSPFALHISFVQRITSHGHKNIC